MQVSFHGPRPHAKSETDHLTALWVSSASAQYLNKSFTSAIQGTYVKSCLKPNNTVGNSQAVGSRHVVPRTKPGRFPVPWSGNALKALDSTGSDGEMEAPELRYVDALARVRRVTQANVTSARGGKGHADDVSSVAEGSRVDREAHEGVGDSDALGPDQTAAVVEQAAFKLLSFGVKEPRDLDTTVEMIPRRRRVQQPCSW